MPKFDEDDFQEEVRAHLAMAERERIADGADPKAARQASLKEFGNVTLTTEGARAVWTPDWLEAARNVFRDLRYAMRSLMRAPGLAIFVVLTLSFGVGMTTTPFSMVDALIFRPYPVPDPGRIVSLVSTSRDNRLDLFSLREYKDLAATAQSYEGVIASLDMRAVGYSPGPHETPRAKGVVPVSGNYFTVLGVQPQLGRVFQEQDDDAPGQDAVVVLAPDFWRRELSADPAIVGRTIRLNGTEFTVVGVAQDSFTGLLIYNRADFYVPLAMTRVLFGGGSLAGKEQKNFFEDRDDRQLTVRARLKPGVTLASARSEIALVAEGFQRAYPGVSHDRGADVHTLFEMRTQGSDVNWKFGVIVSILAIATLLVACTNVAGLLLNRARARTREIAVRLALGSGRARLVRMLLTESLILAAAGGAGGVAVGYAAMSVMSKVNVPTELPFTVPFRVDGRILFASIIVSLVCAIACGLAPALQTTKTDLVNGLKSADIDPPGRRRLWGRNMLVIAQVSMSLMLLTTSVLMYRSFARTLAMGMGFEKDRLLLARFDPRLIQYDPAGTREFYKRLIDGARAMPGVESAALAENPPLSLERFDAVSFVPDGVDMPKDRENYRSTLDSVDESFFKTMGIAILGGRGFQAADSADAPRVAIVNEPFARHYWPDGSAVGRRIRLNDRNGVPVEIVGIAEAARYRETTGPVSEMVYMPVSQHPTPRLMLLLRSAGDPLALASPLKDMVRALDANMPILQLRTFEDLYRYRADAPAVAVDLLSVMGTAGFVLAIAGLYGVVAHNVSRRTREIGIRIAIGAEPADVIRLMMGKGVVLVAIGTGIGIVLGFGIEQLINTALFQTAGVDIVAYAAIVPAMFVIAVLAAYLPARRASKIPPTQALRYE
jgi:predicted permease